MKHPALRVPPGGNQVDGLPPAAIHVFQKMHFFGLGQYFPFEPPRKAWNYFFSSRGSRAAGRVLDFISLESRVEPDGRLEIISLESRVAPGSFGFSGAQFS